MAWHYARFVQAVTARQVRLQHSDVCEHLARGERRQPGDFPSGGPEPWVVDIWRAAGTAIDFYAPDLYDPTSSTGAASIIVTATLSYARNARRRTQAQRTFSMPLAKKRALDSLPSESKTTWIPTGELAASYRAINHWPRSSLNIRPPETYTDSSSTSSHPSADFTLTALCSTCSHPRRNLRNQHAKTGYGLIYGHRTRRVHRCRQGLSRLLCANLAPARTPASPPSTKGTFE